MNRTLTRSLAVVAIAALVAAACGGDDDDDSGDADSGAATTEATTAGDGTTARRRRPRAPAAARSTCRPAPTRSSSRPTGSPRPSTGPCTRWSARATRSTADKQIVRGPLVSGGEETGIDIEVRTGGPAIGDQPVSVQQYADDSITLGYANTEGQILRYGETPVLSVVAPLEVNPQIIYWDPETYPEIETLADLGEEGVTINIFAGGTFADVFVAEGIWNADQIDPSYDGSPARFIAEDGAIAQQGFASAEPYTYEHVFEEWGKPVAFQTLHDAGFEVYSQTLAVRPDQLEELRPCLEAFVPVVQQAAVDYIGAPDRANAIIIDAVDRFDDFWVYDEGLAEYSVSTMRERGYVGNGPDDTLGNMDEERVQGVIDKIRDAGLDVPEDLAVEDIITNEFIDPAIGLVAMTAGRRAPMTTPTKQLHLTITAAIHARFAHRVDGLIHSHPWSIEATVEGPADASKVMPADDLEALLHQIVEPWRGRYLTDTDVGEWKGYRPLVWDAEPTVEEITRRLWDQLSADVPGLVSLALVESTEFDRCRTVRLTVER